MLEKSVTIILCRCRSQCTLLHEPKSLAVVCCFFFFREATVPLILIFPLTIENKAKEFCRQLFKINRQGHAAVGRRERTSSASQRQEMSAGGAGRPTVRTAGPREHLSQGRVLPAPRSLNQCNGASHQTNSFKAGLCGSFLKSFLLRKTKPKPKQGKGIHLKVLTHGFMF